MKYFKYKNELCYIKKGKYSNGRLALMLIDVMGIPYTTITVNIPKEPLPENHIIIRSSEENDGMMQWLIEKDICKKPIDFVPSGYIICPIAELNNESEWKSEELSKQETDKLISEYIL